MLRFTKQTGSDAARKRWQAAHAGVGRTRETRVIEMLIRDSHRPQCVVRMEAQETPHGWSRWVVTQNNRRVGVRTLGCSTVARLLSLLLR